jgi:hypothetical protein
MILSLLAAATVGHAGTLEFQGGDASALAKAVAVAKQTAVAALIYDSKSTKPFSMPLNKAEDFAKDFPRYARWFPSMGKGMGLSKGKLPLEFYSPFPSTKASSFGMTAFDLPRDAIGNTVTVSTDKGTFISMMRLAKWNWPKSVQMHWFFQNMAIALTSLKRSPAETLDAVARAVGARLSESDSAFSIDFNPREFRSRCIESLAEPVAFDSKREHWTNDPERDPFYPIAAAERTLQLEAVKVITDEQLETIFESPGKGCPIDVAKGSPLYYAIMSKIGAYEKCVAKYVKGSEQAQDAYRDMLREIDVSKPPRVYFASPLGVSVAVAAKNGGTILL